jgi:colanic acid/amylovoran biosynthesis protein
MDDERPLFVLAGNGPYTNRGCEAIVRGTTKILREYYSNPLFVCVSHFWDREQYLEQRREEFDPHLFHKQTKIGQRVYNIQWWINSILKVICPEVKKKTVYKEMLPHLDDAQAILSVGGDNYSLDYAIPDIFTNLDDVVLAAGKPLIIWGASVGPFSRIPDYERYMSDHLQKVTAIFARESMTVAYLAKIGVTENVYLVADPAFLLDPVKPEVSKRPVIEEGAIGLNISPLMARHATNGYTKNWREITADIISKISETTGRTIYLIPHVTNPKDPKSDDFIFMKDAFLSLKSAKNNIVLIDPIYTASEMKWIISRMDLFAGARTHSTIAALSSGVPTLSFAYSMKAKGINRDIFGHESYCLDPDQLKPEYVAKKIESMLADIDHIKDNLKVKIPIMQDRAINAGKYLQEVLDGTTLRY